MVTQIYDVSAPVFGVCNIIALVTFGLPAALQCEWGWAIFGIGTIISVCIGYVAVRGVFATETSDRRFYATVGPILGGFNILVYLCLGVILQLSGKTNANIMVTGAGILIGGCLLYTLFKIDANPSAEVPKRWM